MKSATRFLVRHSSSLAHYALIALAFNAHAAQTPLLGVQQIAAGGYHTCVIVNGGVQCWGINLSGELGDGTMTTSVTPVFVTGLRSGVTAITAGGNSSTSGNNGNEGHNCAIVNAAAKCWGDNSEGQLGNYTIVGQSDTPVDVMGLGSGVSAISTNSERTCAVVNGGAQCWGREYLGSGVINGSLNPVAVAGLDSGVTAIATGAYHSCAIVAGGVQCWGSNSNGQIGDGTQTDRLAPVALPSLASGASVIAAGTYHSCAVVNGGAKCWGTNYAGDGTMNDAYSPVAVSGLGTGVTALALGDQFSCAIVNNDATHPVKCWGSNTVGQLGNASTVTALAPVNVAFFPTLTAADNVIGISAGESHACAAIARAGVTRMQCWGDNIVGQLGVGGPSLQSTVPTPVFGMSSGVTAISAGPFAFHNCANVNGVLKCWGRNEQGQLGNGIYVDNSVAQAVVGPLNSVTAIAAYEGYTCALVGAATYCWGFNGDGTFGNGTLTPSPTPVAISGLLGSSVSAIAAGSEFVCAVIGGGAYCWGIDYEGQLGNNVSPLANSYTPVAVVGLGANVSAITTGQSHACAIVSGSVQCWGDNYYGDLGDGTSTQRTSPVAVSGLNSGTVTAISAGENHTCAIVAGGVQCWGYNNNGELGNGTNATSGAPVTVTGLGVGSGVTAIAAGAAHTCAIVNTGVKCWGDNAFGDLGNGSMIRSTTPVAVTGLGSGVIAINAGNYHSCALLNTGAVKCWGDDEYGELGDQRILTTDTPQVVVAGDEIFGTNFDGN